MNSFNILDKYKRSQTNKSEKEHYPNINILQENEATPKANINKGPILKYNSQDKIEIPNYINNTDNIKIPKAPYSDYSFPDYIKVLKAYLKELKDLNITNSRLSQEDVLVLNDLISESNTYIAKLADCGLLKEGFEILDTNEKLIASFFLVFKNIVINNNSNNSKILNNINKNISNTNNANNNINNNNDNLLTTNQLVSLPFVMKLSTLERKFNLYLSTYFKEKSINPNSKDLLSLIDECEGLLNEMNTIQEKLNLSEYSFANSKFNFALLQFFRKNFLESIDLCKEAIEMLEKCMNVNNTSNNRTNTTSINMNSSCKNNHIFCYNDEIFVDSEINMFSKLSVIYDFIAQVYEVLKE